MPVLTIVLEGDGAFASEIAAATRVHHVTGEFKLSCLAGGMGSGKPSVGFCIPLPDGSVVLLETSLRLLLAASDAFKARYGDPR